MKYEINMMGITRRVPAGCKLPAALGQLVDICRQIQRGDLGWFALKHTAPKEFLGFDSGESILSFLCLGDGGFVAFWFQSKNSPAVIHCDSEGEASVVAATFGHFLLRLVRRKTGIPEIDQREPVETPSFKRLPKRVAALAQKRKDFKAWLASNAPETATADDESEEIRQELRQQHAATLEELACYKRWVHGRRSERIGEADGQQHLFDLAQADDADVPIPAEQPEPIPQETRRTRRRRRELDLSRLPHIRHESDLSEEERTCPCCSRAKDRIGEDITKILEYVPAKLERS